MTWPTLLSFPGETGFGPATTAEQVTEGLDLTGRIFAVTGSTSGIGLETVRVLALRGATVVALARTREKAQAVAATLDGRVLAVPCELSDPASVRACVREIAAAGHRLDGLVCNAGIMTLPTLEQVHGVEKQLFTNHVGHFMLATGLLPTLTAEGRVVVVSSLAHERAPAGGIDFDDLSGERRYGPWRAYAQAKFANLLFAKGLHRRFAGTGRAAIALHPGTITTNIGRSMGSWLNRAFQAVGPLIFKSVGQGAATQVFAAAHPKASAYSGRYLVNCNPKPNRKDADDPALIERLWTETEAIVARLPA